MDKPMIWIAGPCVIESEQLVMEIAPRLAQIADRLGLDLYFKASFDKANRTSLASSGAPGWKRGWRFCRRSRTGTA